MTPTPPATPGSTPAHARHAPGGGPVGDRSHQGALCRRCSPAEVELLVLDVDGVLTDGSIVLDEHGRETKRFNIKDGAGLRVWRGLGFKAAVVTGRSSGAVTHRMAELGISEVLQGVGDKGAVIAGLSDRTGVAPERTAFLGDDWPDLSIMRRVGYPMAVGDATRETKAIAAWVGTAPGGHGAVREAIEHLLGARGLMDAAVKLYDAESGTAV